MKRHATATPPPEEWEKIDFDYLDNDNGIESVSPEPRKPGCNIPKKHTVQPFKYITEPITPSPPPLKKRKKPK